MNYCLSVIYPWPSLYLWAAMCFLTSTEYITTNQLLTNPSLFFPVSAFLWCVCWWPAVPMWARPLLHQTARREGRAQDAQGETERHGCDCWQTHGGAYSFLFFLFSLLLLFSFINLQTGGGWAQLFVFKVSSPIGSNIKLNIGGNKNNLKSTNNFYLLPITLAEPKHGYTEIISTVFYQ